MNGQVRVQVLSRDASARYWAESWRADPMARVVADRHYNRQKVGARQFVPPGACVVLSSSRALRGETYSEKVRTAWEAFGLPLPPLNAVDALWITSMPKAEFVKHAWPGAWVCSAFRNEGPRLSSDLIVEAVRVTLMLATVPVSPLGFVSFIDPDKTRRKRDPGRCFVKAGWTRLTERTKAGLVVVQLLPADFPEPLAPLAPQPELPLEAA